MGFEKIFIFPKVALPPILNTISQMSNQSIKSTKKKEKAGKPDRKEKGKGKGKGKERQVVQEDVQLEEEQEVEVDAEEELDPQEQAAKAKETLVKLEKKLVSVRTVIGPSYSKG